MTGLYQPHRVGINSYTEKSPAEIFSIIRKSFSVTLYAQFVHAFKQIRLYSAEAEATCSFNFIIDFPSEKFIDAIL